MSKVRTISCCLEMYVGVIKSSHTFHLLFKCYFLSIANCASPENPHKNFAIRLHSCQLNVSSIFFFNTKHLFDYALHFLAVISHFNYTIILTNFLVIFPQGKFVHECESVDLSRKSPWACGCPSDGLAKKWHSD